jgi:hypothetical protein
MLTCLLTLALIFGASTARGQVSAQGSSEPSVAQDASAFASWDQTADSTTNTQSSYASDLTAGPESPSWLFPITEFNKRLPGWIRIGGQYRNRLEGPTGIGFTGTNDFYLLDRLRVRVIIQPKPWLSFLGEVQDSRVFFNHHISNGNPYGDSWTLWMLTLRSAAPQKGGWMF